MADGSTVRIVEVRAGTSSRPIFELHPDQVVQPTSIGRVGMWPVEGPGVLDVHAFMYFDGRALFLQSADPSSPAKMNGRPIGTNWQQVEIPCTIEIGRARLVYRILDEVDLLEEDEEDKTIAAPIQVTASSQLPAQGGFKPGAFSNRHQPDDESTRFAPIQREPEPTLISPLEAQQRAPAAPQAPLIKPRPAAGAPAPPAAGTVPQAWSPGGYDGPPSSTAVGPAPAPPPPTGYQDMGNVQIAMPPPPQMAPGGGYGAYGVPPGMQGMPGQPPAGQMPGMQETGRLQPPAELTGLAKAKAEWVAMPLIRKIIFASTPIAAICSYVLLTEEDPPPARHRPVPSASASGSMSAAPSLTVATTAPTVTATVTTPPTNTGVPVVDTAPTGAVTATAPTTTGSAKKPGSVSLERQASDALRQGKRDQAAQLYDQLAQQHPENPAYKEAARILRASK